MFQNYTKKNILKTYNFTFEIAWNIIPNIHFTKEILSSPREVIYS